MVLNLPDFLKMPFTGETIYILFAYQTDTLFLITFIIVSKYTFKQSKFCLKSIKFGLTNTIDLVSWIIFHMFLCIKINYVADRRESFLFVSVGEATSHFLMCQYSSGC